MSFFILADRFIQLNKNFSSNTSTMFTKSFCVALRLILLIVVINAATTSYASAQEKKISVGAFDGVLIAGYVDNGGFLNFAGPNIAYKKGSTRVSLGMLPSLRYKKDPSTTTTNSSVFPALGVGLTLTYRKLAFQLPCYYNPKTSTANGAWFLGAGIGWRLAQ